jgi:hypothetical protein
MGNSLESKSAITSSKLVIVSHSSIAHPPQVPAHDVTEQHNTTQHNTTQHHSNKLKLETKQKQIEQTPRRAKG